MDARGRPATQPLAASGELGPLCLATVNAGLRVLGCRGARPGKHAQRRPRTASLTAVNAVAVFLV